MLISSSALFSQKGRKIELFNGKDLKNWAFTLKDASVDPATVFTVKDGVIRRLQLTVVSLFTDSRQTQYG
jgi:hypothetical protein